MFGWVNALFGHKTNQEDVPVGWSPRERVVYQFFDGDKLVKVDPIVVFKRISAVAPELSTSITVALSPSKDATSAHDDALIHIRKIFDIKPYAEGGLTDTEAFTLLDDFTAWCNRLKKNIKNGPT